MYNSIGIALTLSIVGLTFALISTNAELRSIKNILKEALSKKEDVKLFDADESVEKQDTTVSLSFVYKHHKNEVAGVS